VQEREEEWPANLCTKWQRDATAGSESEREGERERERERGGDPHAGSVRSGTRGMIARGSSVLPEVG